MIRFVFYSSLYFFKLQFHEPFLLPYLTLLAHKNLFIYIKYTFVSPYCMHSLSIPITFRFAPLITFYYYPIFFLSLLFFNSPHRLFITFTRISLNRFRGRDSSVTGRVKLQLKGTTTDSRTVSPTWVWVQAQFVDHSDY